MRRGRGAVQHIAGTVVCSPARNLSVLVSAFRFPLFVFIVASILTKTTSSGAVGLPTLLEELLRACSIEATEESISYEEECLESVDRSRFYHLPFLYQSFDGRI